MEEIYKFKNYLTWCKKLGRKPQNAANLGQYLAEEMSGMNEQNLEVGGQRQ